MEVVGVRLIVSVLVCAVVSAATLAAGCGASGVEGKAVFVGGPPEVVGHGKPGLTVTVHADAVTGPVVATRQTGPDGAFRFDLPPGRYVVEMDHGALAMQVTVRAGEYARTTLEMRAK